ncbi:3'-5' exonuclease [Microcoleus sp. FACHB-1515]|nr:3'-5' exonuclease [Microcoleus sp. FACHB-1515]
MIVKSIDLLRYYRSLSGRSLTVVDVETTGKYASRDRITELSVLSATPEGEIIEQQTDLINPQLKMQPYIIRFTGITQAMVDAAAPAANVLPRYEPQLRSGVLTAHNLEFDYGFLQQEYARLGTDFARSPSDQLCTVLLARLLLPDLPSRRLPDLVQHFGFNVGRSHRAEADTIACWLLAKRLLAELNQIEDDVLLKRLAQQWLPLRMIANMLGCSVRKAQLQIEAAGIAPRPTLHKPMYRRGDVEQLLAAPADPNAIDRKSIQ